MPDRVSDRIAVRAYADREEKPLPPRRDAGLDTRRSTPPLDFAEAMRRVEAEVYNRE
jgi:hypothetical protein